MLDVRPLRCITVGLLPRAKSVQADEAAAAAQEAIQALQRSSEKIRAECSALHARNAELSAANGAAAAAHADKLAEAERTAAVAAQDARRAQDAQLVAASEHTRQLTAERNRLRNDHAQKMGAAWKDHQSALQAVRARVVMAITLSMRVMLLHSVVLFGLCCMPVKDACPLQRLQICVTNQGRGLNNM